MQRVQLEYGDGHVEVELPNSAVVVRPGEAHDEPDALADPVAATRAAIETPLGCPPLTELVGPGSKVCIAFPDRVKGGAHPTAHRRVSIPLLFEHLDRAGVRRSDVTLVCAIGLHRKNSRDEMAAYLGDDVVRLVEPHQIVNHDAEDPDGMVTLPDSDLGDTVAVNRHLVDSDLTILLGHTTGNPYGGFSGGYKMPATGLTSWRSIRCHHTPRTMNRADFVPISAHSHFRDQLTAIGQRIEQAMPRRFFTVDAVLNHRSEQLGVFAGAVASVEEASWPLATRRTEATLPGGLADVLVIGIPRNFHYGMGMGSNPILLTQAIGASIARAKGALRPYPVVIAASVCDGWFNTAEFPPYEHAYRLLQSCQRAADMGKYEDEFCADPEYVYKYRFASGYHPFHAFSMIYMGGLARELASAVFVAGAREPGYARGMGAITTSSVEEALREAHRFVGDDPKVLVVPELSKPAYHLTATVGE